MHVHSLYLGILATPSFDTDLLLKVPVYYIQALQPYVRTINIQGIS